MQIAIKRNSFDIVKYLVEQGADVNIVSKKGKTALSLAQNLGYTKIVDYLNKINSNSSSGADSDSESDYYTAIDSDSDYSGNYVAIDE